MNDNQAPSSKFTDVRSASTCGAYTLGCVALVCGRAGVSRVRDHGPVALRSAVGARQLARSCTELSASRSVRPESLRQRHRLRLYAGDRRPRAPWSALETTLCT
jgi:hypothetical protein